MNCRNCNEPVGDNVHGLCTTCNYLMNKFNRTESPEVRMSVAIAFNDRAERKPGAQRLVFVQPTVEERIIAQKIKAKLDKLEGVPDLETELARTVGEPDDGVRGASASPWPALAVTAAVLFFLVTAVSLLYHFWPE